MDLISRYTVLTGRMTTIRPERDPGALPPPLAGHSEALRHVYRING